MNKAYTTEKQKEKRPWGKPSGALNLSFSPTVGKISRQPSEKYFANRRKNVVKAEKMVYNKDKANAKRGFEYEKLQKTNCG